MDIPLIEQFRIQAQVLVPLLRAFQSEIGSERTNEIVRKGLKSYARKLGQELRSQIKGDSMEKVAAFFSICSAGDALDVQVKQTPDVFEGKVTGCRYTQIYKELNATDLGLLCLCELDFP
ncbi:MAG: 2-amino-thiazoline-4-carboxylic acid hydrolase, partial [Gammaproteobacteria bacterium]|nr:2-amino-thiazoline-4-carboxylic acid hydrolase [Gammaproteobacteria bacterium]